MATFNPYLNFKGTTEQAFTFYKSVFGGEFIVLQRYKDVPDTGGKVRPDDGDKVMHVALPIGKNNILMGTDVLESMGQTLVEGTNFSICISVESKAEADELFGKLSAGGKAEMPIQDTFWGSYFGMCTDKFGIQWMVDYTQSEKA